MLRFVSEVSVGHTKAKEWVKKTYMGQGHMHDKEGGMNYFKGLVETTDAKSSKKCVPDQKESGCAVLCHLPRSLIVDSGPLAMVAELAASMWRLWPLKRELSTPGAERACCTCLVKEHF